MCENIRFFSNFSLTLNIILKATNERILLYKAKHPTVCKTFVEQATIVELRKFFWLAFTFRGIEKKRCWDIGDLVTSFSSYLLHGHSGDGTWSIKSFVLLCYLWRRGVLEKISKLRMLQVFIYALMRLCKRLSFSFLILA